jgi:L-methionine (R)-S-oxide reductase
MYETLRKVASLIEGERNVIANLANTAAVLGEDLDDINWVGFYVFDGTELVLGPFWGRPACIRIAVGKGVCGSALEQRLTMVVDDVHAFPGHITCDPASRSELVIPMFEHGVPSLDADLSSLGRPLGVLDVDSPSLSRFSFDDARGLESIAAVLIEGCDWPTP